MEQKRIERQHFGTYLCRNRFGTFRHISAGTASEVATDDAPPVSYEEYDVDGGTMSATASDDHEIVGRTVRVPAGALGVGGKKTVLCTAIARSDDHVYVLEHDGGYAAMPATDVLKCTVSGMNPQERALLAKRIKHA